MRAGKYAALLALLAVLPSGCETEVAGFLSCGQQVCGPRQECVAAEQGSTCVCQVGYVGDACDLCAYGYRHTLEAECELILIDCDDNPTVCGDHGQCTSSADGDYCSCASVYEGRLCENCVDGYQDNDFDGSCEPRCSVAALECESPARCRDTTGTPECVCPAGFVGEQCEQCALGYRAYQGSCVETCETAGLSCGPREVCADSGPAPDCECREGYGGPACETCATDYHLDPATGACLPGCELADLDCAGHGQCSEAAGFAACQCDLAYAGEHCDGCASGYELSADETCRFTPPATHSLLADAMVFGQPTLVALDPVSGDVIAVGEQHRGGLATGAEPGTAFTFADNSVSLLDLPSGAQTLLVSDLSASPALAFDAARERLYAVGSSAPHPLLFVDPTAGSVAPQSDTGLAAVLDLAYDALSDRVLVLGEGLFAVDPTSGEVSALPDPPPATRGIAVAADGTLYALSATDLAPDEARVDACRRSAAGLGLAGYAMAPGSVIEPAADDASLALDSLQGSDVEVVAYLGRGLSAERRTLTITSDNADAVLCLEIREPTTLVVPAAARFRALVAYTLQSEVEVEVDEEFVADAIPAIHLGSVAGEFSFTYDGVRHYTPAEWQALRLAINPRFYAPGPGVLHVLDATFTSTSAALLPDHVRPTGTLTAWTPIP